MVKYTLLEKIIHSGAHSMEEDHVQQCPNKKDHRCNATYTYQSACRSESYAG